MFDIRATQPPPFQPVWPLYGERLSAKSHLPRYRERASFPFFQSGPIDTTGYCIDQTCHRPLSQRGLEQIMDNQSLYQHGIDSGDETCSLHDHFSDGLSTLGPGMHDVSSQTASQSVSLTNCGRAVGSSHPQYSNKTVPGNEQMLFHDDPAANAYVQDLSGSYNQQQFQYPSYSQEGHYNPNLDTEFRQGLPTSSQVYSNMPVFAEPFHYTHLSPSQLSSNLISSGGSSIASEKMALMTLEPIPQDRTPAMYFQGNYPASPPGFQGGNCVGNCPATISPKMLRINPSPTPTSSSEYTQASITSQSGDPDLGSSPWNQQEEPHALPTKRSTPKARKQLPTQPIKPRLAASSSLKSAAKVDVQQSPLQRLTEPAPARVIRRAHRTVKVEQREKTLSPNPIDAERDAKNRFLVEAKLAGMTYSEIRKKGGFTEAESTLRGRFRTLTKNKEQRVRKPEWQDKDIRLLKKAVRELSQGDRASAKVPWKQVASYIYENEGSYHFGNATCRKKWDELVEQGAEEL
ncbi:hypothetical protein F5Y07DRAFT_410895 [Xylaria sp. FL0933]|nr:hypothetical protein F5Y07DRAFT_410895 [Xylaria sp. FL0933]